MRLIRWVRRNPKYATIGGLVLVYVLFFLLNYFLMVTEVITPEQYEAGNEAAKHLVQWVPFIP